jgi:hypothetical protein
MPVAVGSENRYRERDSWHFYIQMRQTRTPEAWTSYRLSVREGVMPCGNAGACVRPGFGSQDWV